MKEYTVKVFDNGNKYWYLDGKRHREDGPTIEKSNGYKAWYLNDKRHREDGPAIETSNGHKAWYLNGELHREDGPVIEYSDGSKHWYLNDTKLSEQEFKKRTKSCNNKVVIIDGVEYTLVKTK